MTPPSTAPPRGAFLSEGRSTRLRQITESSTFPQLIQRVPNFPTRTSSYFTSYSDSIIMNPSQRAHFIEASFFMPCTPSFMCLMLREYSRCDARHIPRPMPSRGGTKPLRLRRFHEKCEWRGPGVARDITVLHGGAVEDRDISRRGNLSANRSIYETGQVRPGASSHR